MLRLHTFGALTVERDGVLIAATAQRRGLAVLAVLGRAGAVGASRDQIAALLWPDSPEEHGRNALRQVLFRLRRELDAPEAVVGTSQLRLNAAVISCDVSEFEAALDAGDREHAIALYRGAFLDGFNLPAAPEFARWADTQRTTLALRAAGALEQLAVGADRRSDTVLAVSYWRRLAALDPLSTRAALGLVRALIGDGDLTGAVQQARLHQAITRQELGLEPDDAVTSLAEVARAALAHGRAGGGAHLMAADVPATGADPSGLADRPPADGVPPSCAATAEASGVVGGGRSERQSAPAAAALSQAGTVDVLAVVASAGTLGDARDERAQDAPVAWRRFVRRRARAVALAVGGIGVVLGAAGARRALAGTEGPLTERSGSANRVAVFPFAVDGPSRGHERLGVAAGEMLSAALDGAGVLRTTDTRATRAAVSPSGAALLEVDGAREAAARLGAARFVLGHIVLAGDRLVVTAGLYASASRDGAPAVERIGEASVETEPGGLASSIDQLTIGLLRVAHGGPAEQFASTATRATSSLPALKAFLSGEAQFRAGEYGKAVDAYTRAVQHDSLFALAYYRLSVAADWASAPDVLQWATTRAERFAARLSDHDRARLRALVAWHAGDARKAESIYRLLVTRHPDDVESWYQLGEAQFHLGPAYGGRVLDARPAFERVLALQPGHREAMAHLQRLAAKAGNRAQGDSLGRAFLSGVSEWEVTQWLVMRAFSFGGAEAQTQALDLLRRSADETVMHAAIRTAVYAEDLGGARAIAQLLTEGPRPRPYRVYGTVQLAFLEMAMGRRRRANASLDVAERELGLASSAARATLAALPWVPASRTELLALRDSVRRWPADAEAGADSLAYQWPLLHRRFRPWALGMLSVRLGDTRDAERQADALDQLGDDPLVRALTHDLAQLLRAEVALLEGDPQRALSLAVSETAPLPSVGAVQSLVGSRAHQRYLRADLLARLGREEEALRWLDAIGDLSVSELVYLAPAELRQAEIHERRGDVIRAAAHYRRFIDLWRGCEPELRPLVRIAERRLVRLAAR